MKITHKLLVPNVLYAVLLGIVLFIYLNSNQMIHQLKENQNKTNELMSVVQDAALNIKDYLNKKISYQHLIVEYDDLMAHVQGLDMVAEFEQIKAGLAKIDSIRQANAEIENQIGQLTEHSIKQSNGYITMVSQKLADEAQRSNVTTLERLVIIGANTNTTANYELKALFGQLREDLKAKDNFIQYIETLLKNVEADIQRLAGTPYQEMARAAKNANLEIQDLALKFIKNVEDGALVETVIFEGIAKGIKGIENIAAHRNTNFFSTIKTYFSNILYMLVAVILLGGIISFFISKSISRLLSNTIDGLNEASDQIASGSNQVAASSQSLAEGASEQAASIEETSSSLEEMSAMTNQNADNARQADNLMKAANQVVHQANDSMTELTHSMDEISKASAETSKIIKTIDEIAFQTNLLALNAAVEAARAGAAGSGFAVVADEVRNLAMRAADAAKTTAELIETTVNKTCDGTDLVNKTNDAFGEVAQSAAKVGGLVGEIAAASGEQSQGIGQVNCAVTEMDKVVQQNAANAEESAAASEELNAQAAQMRTMIDGLITLVGVTSINRRKPKAPRNRLGLKGIFKSFRRQAVNPKTSNVKACKQVQTKDIKPLADDTF